MRASSSLVVIIVAFVLEVVWNLPVNTTIYCIPLTECPLFEKLLKNESVYRTAVAENSCGIKDQVQKVWCPKKGALESPNVTSDILTDFATECKTPNGDDAYCVGLSTCSAFAQLSITPQHASYDFFVASNCTPKNTKFIKVCCGTKINFDLPVYQLPKDCGKQKLPTISDRIMGGTPTAIGEFPWMGILLHQQPAGTVTVGCMAFLIHERFAISAAHCFKPTFLEQSGPVRSIRLGEHNLTSTIDCDGNICALAPQEIPVYKHIVHSGYDPNSKIPQNDIALIQLKEPAKFTDFVGPICLRDRNGQADSFTSTGWGMTETMEPSDVKMKVELNRFPANRCLALYRAKGVVLNETHQICAGGEKGKDTCMGDSGGPLMSVDNMTTWYAEGIVSFGIACGREGTPGIYTNIPSYLPWIKETISKSTNFI